VGAAFRYTSRAERLISSVAHAMVRAMWAAELGRWVAITAAIVVVGYGGYKLVKRLTRSDESKALEARQDKARSRTHLEDDFQLHRDSQR
jgi:hypothetical protein